MLKKNAGKKYKIKSDEELWKDVNDLMDTGDEHAIAMELFELKKMERGL